MAIAQAELDTMQQAYKDAVDAWINVIRVEESLASPAEHSQAQLDQWETAFQNEEEARARAKQAKSAYEDALRQEFFNF